MRRLLPLLGLVMLCMQLAAQQRTIIGKVKDATGKPIPNASVVIKGSSAGTTTGTDGSYSLSIPASAKVLVFSGIGFTDMEIPIGNKSQIDASLLFSDKNLQEVVVVGYGTQQKKAFTGSASKVD